MKNFTFLFAISLLSTVAFSQVGIGTVTPSPAAALDISGSNDGGITYKGFLPPRIPNPAARASINPQESDVGLMIFYEERDCIQVWNGTAWESIYCLNEIAFTAVVQNFDAGTSWGYSSDVPFFDNGSDGFYGVTNTSNGLFANLTTLTNNFLGIYDLQDDNDGGNGGTNGTDGFATVTFNTIDVSSAAATGTTVAFDWEVFEYDNGDDIYYTVTIDGIDQTEVFLVDGAADFSSSGSESIAIPAGSVSVGFRFRVKQNGESDVAGFDNFRIFEN